MKKAILASNSPRRKELMGYLPLEFSVMPADIDETFSNELSIEENVMRTACLKAKEVEKRGAFSQCDFIIASDTVVSINNVVLGKPHDYDDAIRMLKLLSGACHSVFSGVCIISKEKTLSFYDETKVLFAAMSEKEIEEYVKTNEPMDKAGAYAIQGDARLFIEQIEGNYDNVVGLPLAKLYSVLKKEFNLLG